MPSRDYAESPNLMRFFKAIPEDWYTRSSGNVEAPSGWFGILYTDADLLEEYGADLLDVERDTIPLGVFLFITIDSNGLCWAESAAEHDSVLGMYSRAEKAYLEWVREDDDE